MFTLNIECSKEFDELHIVFSDGTGMVTTKPSPEKNKKQPINTNTQSTQNTRTEPKQRVQKTEEYLDLDADFGSVSQEVVEKPVIENGNRAAKVAEELQYLDI